MSLNQKTGFIESDNEQKKNYENYIKGVLANYEEAAEEYDDEIYLEKKEEFEREVNYQIPIVGIDSTTVYKDF